MPFEATLSKPLALKDQVYQVVREQLRQGAIGPDERLVDLALAKTLNISRTPVREALQTLAHEGLLQATTRGFKLGQLTQKEVSDLFELRLILEPKIARKAAANASESEVAALQASVDMARSALDDPQSGGFNTAVYHFFNTLVALSDNIQMNRSVLLYHDRLVQLRVPLMATVKQRQLAVTGFDAIASAIAKGDQQLAETTSITHIQNGINACRDIGLIGGDA